MRHTVSRLLAVGFLAASAMPEVDGSSQTAATDPGTHRLLDRAFEAFLDGQQRWAYTEIHTSFEPDGRAHLVSEIRFDPSQSYDKQFMPLQIVGRSPSAKEIKAWAERGEQLARLRDAEARRRATRPQDTAFRLRLLNRDVTPDLDLATVAAEDEVSVTFAIPLRHAGSPGAKFAEFELTARVSKLTAQFERATFRQRSIMRVAAGKYANGIFEVEFGTPDPRYPAVPMKLSWRSTNKPLFGQARASRSETVRTDLRRVTPYDERFKVQLAPLRLLDF